MIASVTGAILAEDFDSRFGGTPKSLMRLDGQRIINRIYRCLATVFPEIIIVTNDPQAYLDLDATLTTDIYSIPSALAGLHTALTTCRTPFVFITRCDTPFLQSALVRTLAEAVTPESEIIMPETGTGVEPLCAVYSRRCLDVAETYLKKGDGRILQAMRKRRTRLMTERRLKTVDPDLNSFFKIKTPEDLERARKRLANIDPLERETPWTSEN